MVKYALNEKIANVIGELELGINNLNIIENTSCE